MKVMYLQENDKFFCEESSIEFGYYHKQEIPEEEFKRATESLYWYQHIDLPGRFINDPLIGQWVCCGLAHDKPSQKDFYSKYFKTHDLGREVGCIDRLVIVRGFRGNVAGRDGLPITVDDIIEEF